MESIARDCATLPLLTVLLFAYNQSDYIEETLSTMWKATIFGQAHIAYSAMRIVCASIGNAL